MRAGCRAAIADIGNVARGADTSKRGNRAEGNFANTVIPGVCDEEVALRVKGNAAGKRKLCVYRRAAISRVSRACSRATAAGHRRDRLIQCDSADFVILGIRHINVSCRINAQACWLEEYRA